MAFPDEIVAGAVEVYTAPIGTAFPVINVAPAAAWILLGTQGSLNISEAGVSISSEVEESEFVPLGSIFAVKSWLTKQDLRVEFDLADISLEMLDKAFGGAATAAGAVVVAAGPPATKTLDLTRSSIATQVKLLIRSVAGPYGPVLPVQWQINRAASMSNPSLTFVKGVPAMAHFIYRIYRDSAGVGSIVAQTA